MSHCRESDIIVCPTYLQDKRRHNMGRQRDNNRGTQHRSAWISTSYCTGWLNGSATLYMSCYAMWNTDKGNYHWELWYEDNTTKEILEINNVLHLIIQLLASQRKLIGVLLPPLPFDFIGKRREGFWSDNIQRLKRN